MTAIAGTTTSMPIIPFEDPATWTDVKINGAGMPGVSVNTEGNRVILQGAISIPSNAFGATVMPRLHMTYDGGKTLSVNLWPGATAYDIQTKIEAALPEQYKIVHLPVAFNTINPMTAFAIQSKTAVEVRDLFGQAKADNSVSAWELAAIEQRALGHDNLITSAEGGVFAREWKKVSQENLAASGAARFMEGIKQRHPEVGLHFPRPLF